MVRFESLLLTLLPALTVCAPVAYPSAPSPDVGLAVPQTNPGATETTTTTTTTDTAAVVRRTPGNHKSDGKKNSVGPGTQRALNYFAGLTLPNKPKVLQGDPNLGLKRTKTKSGEKKTELYRPSGQNGNMMGGGGGGGYGIGSSSSSRGKTDQNAGGSRYADGPRGSRAPDDFDDDDAGFRSSGGLRTLENGYESRQGGRGAQ